jgi:hypothetical protein
MFTQVRSSAENGEAPVVRGPCHDPARERSAAALMLLCGSASAAERLGGHPVDPAQVSVSGISPGAFMANPSHIAHSADIVGAGRDRGRSTPFA